MSDTGRAGTTGFRSDRAAHGERPPAAARSGTRAEPPAAPPAASPPSGWSDRRIAFLVGIAATALGLAGIWIPSYWGDEAATLMSARRDWASLAALLGTIDAVHGLYYAFMHLWIDLVGTSPFAVRLPSGLAFGAAAAGLYLLVRTRADRGTALVAASVLAMTPRVTQAATEARPLAFATATAVWLTLLLVRLLDGRMPRAWWWAYGAGVAAAGTLNLYVLLLVPVHAVAAIMHPARRARLGAFAGGVGVAAVLAAPIMAAAVSQREQIAFREDQEVVTLTGVLVGQWFMLVSLAVVAWALVVAGVVLALVHRADPAWAGRRWLLAVALAWIVIPTTVLVAVTALVTPAYTPRYLVFCAPGAAIAIAVAASALRRGWQRALIVVAVAALALPAYVDQRTPYSKNAGTDWQDVSATVERLAEPGDGVLFDEGVRPSRRPRLAMHTYPDGFAGLRDLGLVRAHDRTDGLWDVTAPLAEVVDRLRGIDRVVVVSRSERGADDDIRVLLEAGFVERERVQLESDVVRSFERRPLSAGSREPPA
ncbi:glycosyltransferase family 39 protein [Agromyces agglutinans]|nr:glycosyltransferase family 39 protein [Agromyces agglutinans]